MNLYMPEIFWHDRKGILCVDIQQKDDSSIDKVNFLSSKKLQQYKIVTASIQKEIRVWVFYFDRLKDDKDGKELYQLSVDFLANIVGHDSATNVVKFSPNGKFLASGDVDGALLIWKISVREELPLSPEKEKSLHDEFPPNKENWVRAFRVPIKHYGDVTCIAWSPDSTMIASVATDDTISVHKVDTGKQVWSVRNFRHYANGITWDPRGKYIVTVSTDRRLDIIEASKGTRLRCCHKVELPQFIISGEDNKITQQSYKIFHDDQLYSFMRGVEFSPCGSFVFAPAGHLEVGEENIYGTFVFKRSEFDKCRPFAMIPSTKPTLSVKCSPVFYKLRPDVEENFLQLPFRLIFAVLCKESVLFYDSQFSKFFSYVDNFQFDHLTNMSWTPDGKVFVISSLEGYNTFITFNADAIGTPCEDQEAVKLFNCSKETEMEKCDVDQQSIKIIDYPDSPKLIVPKKTPKVRKEIIGGGGDGAADHKSTASQSSGGAVSTPFVIIKRKKPENSSPASSPLGVKRKKDADGTPRTPLQEKKDAERPSSVQKKINELW